MIPGATPHFEIKNTVILHKKIDRYRNTVRPYMSSSLIIHEDKSKEINSMKEI